MINDLSFFDEAKAPGETGRTSRFLPVAEAEMAFALSLFVGAADGGLREMGREAAPADSTEECERLLGVLSRGVGAVLRDDAVRQYLCSVEGAFRAVWRQYEGDERQASVCARVLGFYYLMEQSGGALMERWVTACEGSEEVVVLHPLVVETLACVPLMADGVLSREMFVSRLEARAM